MHLAFWYYEFNIVAISPCNGIKLKSYYSIFILQLDKLRYILWHFHLAIGQTNKVWYCCNARWDKSYTIHDDSINDSISALLLLTPIVTNSLKTPSGFIYNDNASWTWTVFFFAYKQTCTIILVFMLVSSKRVMRKLHAPDLKSFINS